MNCKHRFQYTLVLQVVFILTVLTAIERQCNGQIRDSVIVEKQVVETIFPQPSKKELTEITQPKLREKLLKMVSDDQIARRSGT